MATNKQFAENEMNRTLERGAVISFRSQLRQSREHALRDAEAFDEIIHTIELLGLMLYECDRVGDLGKYKAGMVRLAAESALAEDVPQAWRDVHMPFSLLYDIVTNARNDALHVGAYA